MSNPLDTPGVPFEIELMNPNPSSRRTKDGPVYRLSFEVKPETHTAFMQAAESNLRLVGYLSVLPDTDEEPAHKAIAEKQEKGPWGQLWRHLRIAGVVNCPGVREAIALVRHSETEDVWIAIHRVFDVETLATVGPNDIYVHFPVERNPQVKVMVEQALRKAEEAAK
jgi:hypothetical protein